MSGTFLSRFTPSMMAPEVLEAIFVQRQQLAERLIDLIRESVNTRSKHHTLLIGPRGIGKTHLASLIYHRVKKSSLVSEKQLRIAWLREEEWGVMSFLDLLLRILRALVEGYNDEELERRVEGVYGMDQVAAERTATELLKGFLGPRSLLIIIENLDDLFSGLGDEGQKRLRSYLQENPFSTILATSQSLFGGISLQTSPFYGFFRITHLEELNIDDASLLLKNIAELEGNDDLAGLIGTSLGRARIRAIHRLAGGNHRVYIIFSQFLTRESLNELIEALMRTLDELTPYYQERIRWLSQQQRKIVGLLCDRGNALSVKEIATRSFMSQQTASGQLKLLREMGYVQTTPLGRESYYELREPLMRLCIEVKKHCDKPIRLVVELLRSWYTTKELEERLRVLPFDVDGPRSEREHIQAALKKYQSAEVLVSFSNTERINQAALAVAQGRDADREVNAQVLSDAVTKMARLIARRHYFYKLRSLHSPDDLAQTALLKFLTLAESRPPKLKNVENFAGFLYTVVYRTAQDMMRQQFRRHQREILQADVGEYIPELDEFRPSFEYIVDPRAPSPDQLLDMRALLLHKTQSYLFEAARKQKTFRKKLADLARDLTENGAGDVLSESLIRCFIFISEDEDGEAQNLSKYWYEVSKKALESYTDFALTLRILEKIVRYRKTKDNRILLELRLEERTFLEPLLESP